MKPEDYPPKLKEVILKMNLGFIKEGLDVTDSSGKELPKFPKFKDKEQKFMFNQYLDWFLDSKITIKEMEESIQDAVKEEAFEHANGIQSLVTYIDSIK